MNSRTTSTRFGARGPAAPVSRQTIHVDNEDRSATALAVEVANGGETHNRI